MQEARQSAALAAHDALVTQTALCPHLTGIRTRNAVRLGSRTILVDRAALSHKSLGLGTTLVLLNLPLRFPLAPGPPPSPSHLRPHPTPAQVGPNSRVRNVNPRFYGSLQAEARKNERLRVSLSL